MSRPKIEIEEVGIASYASVTVESEIGGYRVQISAGSGSRESAEFILSEYLSEMGIDHDGPDEED